MTSRKDPFAQFNFILSIEGTTEAVAGFTEVAGMISESNVIEYREGSDPPTMRLMPGVQKPNRLILKRGVTRNRELWDWRKTTLDGHTQRRSGSIVLRDEEGKEVWRLDFNNAWISKWEGPAALNAKTNEAALESIEIAHEGLVLAD